MTLIGTLRRPAVRRAALLVSAGAALALALAIPGGHDATPERGAGGVPPTSAAGGTAATRAFFDRYVEPDGRVVRHDQGGDTVSEGQAYAMLLAVGIHDEDRFLSVWEWARRNLQRPDGLLSWHWRDGAVIEPQPAADADVDAARALVLAADQFNRPDLRDEGGRIARGVLDHEVVTADDRTALAAGPWAVAERIVNPSYFSPCAAADLARATGDPRWGTLADDAVALIDSVTQDGQRLPPDWSHLDDTGRLQPAAGPGDARAEARYGLDATRVPLRLAEACKAPGRADDAARHLAALLWPTLRPLPDDAARVAYHLDGTPAVEAGARHPAGLVGAAAAAGAAGDGGAADRLFGEATALDRQNPTYYGAALLALAQAPAPGGRAAEAIEGPIGPSPVGGLRLIASTKAPVDPATSTTTAPPSSTTTTAGPTTTASTAPTTTTAATTRQTTTTRDAGAGRPNPPTTTASTGPDPPAPQPADHGRSPERPIPRPLQPGILTRPPAAPSGQPPPGTPAQPADAPEDSTPARTTVLLTGAGFTGLLGTRLGRRSL